MADKTLQLKNNITTEVEGVTASAGAADAGKIAALGPDGRFDDSLLPAGIGADTKIYPASEVLAAGDYVNIWDDAGTAKVRKADASAANAGKRAHGFVRAGVGAIGSDATVYFEGPNSSLSGLIPGATYVLSHTSPGGVVPLASGTATAGHILQIVGVATAVGEINAEIGNPVVRA
ncbi:hypothetical protein [Stenotrophomonas maltophilia]|uniref:hypothetical protein n=1 Tax=Stenotrophomonas maltophilia TaxID=40324 RepID=UPI000B4DE2EF|nr:hypothetical protein [Stenotrophomonas maltophilia]OWQ68452.1 hypothetical protein CEE58_01130 [Stenotrophomonas maltophilia]